jgi:hypothetical protein
MIMIRNIAVCLMSVGSSIAPAQRLPISRDPVREAESQQRVLLDRVNQQDGEAQSRQRARRREFEASFNQLVAAIDSFANEYNESKGTIWPQREADKLRKAMRQLQSFEQALRDDSKAAPAQRERKF